MSDQGYQNVDQSHFQCFMKFKLQDVTGWNNVALNLNLIKYDYKTIYLTRLLIYSKRLLKFWISDVGIQIMPI